MPFRLTYRPALDGLRGVAILGVFAHHAQVPYLRGGFIGVDIFFVLSRILVAVAGIAEATVMRVVLWNGAESWRRLSNGLDTRIDGLLIGALAALVLASLPNLDVLRRRAFRVVVVTAALTLATVLHYGRAAAPPMYFGVGSLVSLCAALVLIGTFAADTCIGSLLAFGPLVVIRRISYGLYLWHYPVIAGVFENHRLAPLGVH